MEVGLGPGEFGSDGDPSPLPKTGTEPPPQFSAHVHCGQTAGWIKTALGTEAGRGPGHLLHPSLKTGRRLSPIFGPFLLWPNGWMRWRQASAQTTVLDGDPASSPKGGRPPIFNPCLLWPNGWIDQDGTWYGGRPRPRRRRVRLGPSWTSPKRGRSPLPNFRLVYCGQTARRIKMPLATEVNLGPGDVVLDGVAGPPKRGTAPKFLVHVYCGQTAWWMKIATWYGSRPRPNHIVLDRDPAHRRKGYSTLPSFRPMSLVATVAHLSYCWALV